MPKDTYNRAPTLRFDAEPPQERLPNAFLGRDFLDAACAPYPGNVRERFEAREYQLSQLRDWAMNATLGLGNQVMIDSAPHERSKQFGSRGYTGPVKIVFIGELGKELVDVRAHFTLAGVGAVFDSRPLIDLNELPELTVGAVNQEPLPQEAPSHRLDIVALFRSFKKRQEFERRRSNATTALVELKQLCDESPSVLIPEVYGAVSAPKRKTIENCDEPGRDELYLDYLRGIGFHAMHDQPKLVGHINEVILNILHHERDSDRVQQFWDVLVRLEEKTEEYATREPGWDYDRVWQRRKKSMQRDKKELKRTIKDALRELIELGFSGYLEEQWVVLSTCNQGPEWLSSFEIESLPLTPDDVGSEQSKRLWRLRHAMVSTLVAARSFDMTEDQLRYFTGRAHATILHHSELLRKHPGSYTINDEAIAEALRKSVVLEATKNSLVRSRKRSDIDE